MAFLTKKEQTMINLINLKKALDLSQRKELIKEIKYNSQLRQDQYRKPVKIFLSALVDFKNAALLQKALK